MDSPLKWHGGKSYLAQRIIDLMPPHTHYVEPYAGGLSVLLAKNPVGVSEVVNDLNGELTNFWRVLADEGLHLQFFRILDAVPFSEVEWQDAGDILASPEKRRVSRAVAFFIRMRQSFGGAGKSFSPMSKTRTRRGMNEQVSAWLNCVEGLPEIHERMKRVVIYNKPALEVVRQQDGPSTLFYLDPPYLQETRTSPEVYEHEMKVADHIDLLSTLAQNVKGKFMLSGYCSKLYYDYAYAEGWKRHDFDMPNNAAGGKTKRRMTECVWCNF